MAYVFDRISGALEDDQDKIDVFAEGDEEQKAQEQAPLVSPTIEKTSVEGELGAAPKKGVKVEEEKLRTQAPSEKLMGLTERVKGPGLVGQKQAELGQAEQALQQQAEQYVAGAKKPWQVSEQEMTEAVQGSEPYFKGIQNLLQQRYTPTATPAFEAPKVDVGGLERLGTEAGLRGVLREERGPGAYTGGEAALEAMLLGKSAGFQQQKQALEQQQQALREQAALAEQQATADRQAQERASLLQAQQDVRDWLTGQAGGMKSGWEQEAEDYNRMLQDQQARMVGGLTPGAELQRAAIMRDILAKSPELTQYMPQIVTDPNVQAAKFFQMGGPAAYQQFVDANEQAQFNRIMGLLGEGDAVTAQAPAGPIQSFDVGGYRTAVEDALRAAQAAAAKPEVVRQPVSTPPPPIGPTQPPGIQEISQIPKTGDVSYAEAAGFKPTQYWTPEMRKQYEDQQRLLSDITGTIGKIPEAGISYSPEISPESILGGGIAGTMAGPLAGAAVTLAPEGVRRAATDWVRDWFR